MVMSVPSMSLSIEPTSPAIISAGWRSAVSRSTVPEATSSETSDGHSWRRRSAPDRLPSPPITTSRSMPCSRRCRTARSRPSRWRNAAERAVPITVPPRFMMLLTSFQASGRMRSPPSTSPCQPS
jgi:hypothetical protein